MRTLRTIEVVPHDPEWKHTFEQEVAKLRSVFGRAYLNSHHIGSTSVPGLHAKPTIDIVLEVSKGTRIPSFYPQMEDIGYTCRGECLDAVIPGIPGRFYFVQQQGPTHLIHTHAYETGHADIDDKLTLRDYLITHAGVATSYGKLKLKLARQFTHDNIGYMRGKDNFLQQTIMQARAWKNAR